MRRRFDLPDFEWLVIESPASQQATPCVSMIAGVITGYCGAFVQEVPWANIPERYGPRTTRYNRFVR